MNNYRAGLIIVIALILCAGCKQSVLPPDPFGPVPTDNQVAWHEMEYYGLVCYGLNTYTRQEWGFGDVDAKVFDPSNLDTDQWARIAKEAGMKGLILVAKHHDGFCLWPSKTTNYTVAASPWKDGQGDVLRDLAKSCKKYDLKLGVYVSPWDRNHAEYGKPGYVKTYHEQLMETLEYSDDVFEVYIDGANGGTGYYGGAREKRTIEKGYYQFPELFKLIKEKQPKTVLFGYVEDVTTDVVRWGGTEEGTGSETNWCGFDDATLGDHKLLMTGKKDGKHWMPVEGNTTILYPKKWYYNENSQPRTLKNFVDLYYTTIGQNATFILGLSIGPDGLIPERDAKAMLAQKKQIDIEFAQNLASEAKITAENSRGRTFSPKNIDDGSTSTYWATADSVKKSSIVIDFKNPTTFNRLLLQEYIQLGQRIHKFSLEIESGDEWKEIAKGTTIGYKRILRFDDVEATRAKITFHTDAPCILISNVELYHAPPLVSEPVIRCDKNGLVTINAIDNLSTYYALGEKPSESDFKEFVTPFKLPEGGKVSAFSLHEESRNKSDIIFTALSIAKTKWKIKESDNRVFENNATLAFDADPNTCWYSSEGESKPSLLIDIGEEVELSGFGYLPPKSALEGIIFEYGFYTSNDGVNWKKEISNEFSNIENNPIKQVVSLNEPVRCSYVKLISVSRVKNCTVTGIAELDIYTNH